jgi:hypothetical protein
MARQLVIFFHLSADDLELQDQVAGASVVRLAGTFNPPDGG